MQYLIFKKHDQNNLQLFSLIINALLLYVQPPPSPPKKQKNQNKQKNRKNNPLVFALKQQTQVFRGVFLWQTPTKCLNA